MNSVPNLTPDPTRSPDGQARARWSTPGLSDGLGDRMLMFDHGTATLLEVLRFKREFGDSPAFEAALRERVERLRHLLHPSLAVIRGVENLAGGDGLALVSKQTAGRRLSDLLPEARGTVFAVESIRQLTPALARLHQAGDGYAHGALTADRVVVTREGRLVIVEHVLGSALQSLQLPASRLRTEIGVAAPGNDGAPLDARADVIQLGLIALSLALGRRIDPAEFPVNLASRLEEFSRVDAGSPASTRLRRWLERALQIDARPFQSAQEAHDGFDDAATESSASKTVAVPDAQPPVAAFHAAAAAADAIRAIPEPETPAPQVQEDPTFRPTPSTVSGPGASNVLNAPVAPVPLLNVQAAPVPVAVTPVLAVKPATAAVAASPLMEVAKVQAAMPPAPVAAPVPAKPATARPSGSSKAMVFGLGLVAAAEAVVIAGLIYARPATIVVETKAPANAVPSGPAPVIEPRNEALAANEPPTPAKPALADAAPATKPKDQAADRPVAGGERFGGIRVTAPIDLQVFEAGKLLGSTSAPIAISEGSHAVDVVNDALSFSAHVTVDVKSGQMAALSITLPTARVSINAVPWADVTIDGTPAGQTPIANLTLPIGKHEVSFTHPQLGEQHQTVMVKAGVLTRVSATLQK